MKTTSLPMTFTFLDQNLKINSTLEIMSNKNDSYLRAIPVGHVGMSCFTMIFGTISNLTALGILAKSRVRFRRQSKAPFLFLTVALLLADLGGHVILGAFVLYLYTIGTEPTPNFCKIFGTSMVFFGLCPLLLGCAMAVERYIAITKPFFHMSMITVAHVKMALLFLSSVALVLAVLPLFSVGTYTTQIPKTWCFLNLQGEGSADRILALTFSGLGLTALTLSLFCNILSGLALLHARTKYNDSTKNPTTRCGRRASSASSSSMNCSLDVEMMAQLAAITVVSCVCWGPFLIHIPMVQLHGASGNLKPGLILLFLRMASWNQILDPWVYILLRRAVLLSVCCRGQTPASTVSECSSYRDYRRRDSNLQ
ncbi:prostaglandin E receptor 1c (subtype EP1) [Cololabis saira]|uniref:prostaglandin E receptor 1c (subtype EP1) n=1 Tax=Cololabis saira TaxID=129043 RepID=UPI002AD3714F|nr:prostaglandin E receptor 1c (subtype EP1) [Cololabis saira]